MKLVFGWTRSQIVLCLGALLLTVLSSLQFNTAASQAQSQVTTNNAPKEITQGWQYYGGDLPLDQVGDFVWTKDKISNLNWKPFQFPKKLKKPQGKNIIWLRVSLPKGQWKSPTLYLKAVPNILGAYLDRKVIYTQLSLNSSGQANFKEYQLPLVPLGENFAGKTLLFRVYVGQASHIYVGLFDRVTIGFQGPLIKRLLGQEIEALFSIVFIFIGLFSLLLSLKRQEKAAYLYFGLLSVLIGVYTISRSSIITLFFKDLVILRYVEYGSLYLIPFSACSFFTKIFLARDRVFIRLLGQINLAFVVVALSLSLTSVFPLNWTLVPAQFLLVFTAITLLVATIKISLLGNGEAKLFVVGFLTLTLTTINDLLIYWLEPVNWYQKLYPWGTLGFLLILAFILEQRFAEARKTLQNYARELEAKNAALRKLDQLKDEFLANTSHELKTPLNGIIGIAESLIDGATGKLSQQTVFNLSMIASSGKRLNQLVNDLLDFSQLKHKKIELKLQPVGMREIADVVLMISQPLVKNKPLQLINKIDPNTPPVDADENRVQQILYNLVGNAIKFTESGTVEISAAVIEPPYHSLKKVKHYLEITVADTGIGIHVDKLDRIFESFEQADGSIAREYGGAGLGLAVTKQLVQLHGGHIRVESTPGSGSRFSFTLPLSKSKVEKKPQEEVSKIHDFGAMKVNPDDVLIDGETLVPTEGAFQILIVDDEPVNLQVLVNHLSLQNYAITQATSGMEALEIIHNGFIPDLILLDVMMPKMTGYELCQKIREQFPATELPVVLLTAKDQVSDLVEGFGAGANDYLTKPISKNELLARIKTHLRLAKINAAYGRFVPHEFLKFLERESIVDVKLGDQVQKEMTVLFADIRSFTTLSEKMSPKENFDFINDYLSRVSPVIRKHNGFIDKYIGDAIMALFPQTANDAVQAAIEMQKQVSLYNSYRQKNGEQPIAIGIGLHTGSLMLGTVGELQRMEGTVIADAVNLASRLEGLTKFYGVDILISEETLYRLDDRQNYQYRFLGRVKVKGKSKAVDVFEVYDTDPQYLIELKMQTRGGFEQGVAFYVEGKIDEAQQLFQQVLQKNNQDKAAKLYIERCDYERRLGRTELNTAIS